MAAGAGGLLAACGLNGLNRGEHELGRAKN